MRKLLITLALAGSLSVPSVVFAEASWYGSLRAGLDFSGGQIAVKDGGSRWGIKGSAEAGEGLTAVYQFEHKIDAATASLGGGGRLSYVGLSGGFGTVTAGQIWSASYNSAGAITDNSYFNGDSQTTYRHGNAASYAFSNDLMALQFDAVYADPSDDGFKDNPNDDLERTEFGLSVNIGDMGKVAVAFQDDKYTLTDVDTSNARSDGDTTWRTKTTTVAAQVSVSDLTAYVGSQNANSICTGVVAGTGSNACDGTTDGQVNSKAKTTFFGIRGGLGDTGINYVFQWRDKKDDGKKPWILGLGKSLGGGASMQIEHSNVDGGDNATRVNLQVNF